MIPAPKGLSAMFQIGEDTIGVPVIAFSEHGKAMVLHMERGYLVVARDQPDFVALIWDNLEQ